MTILHSLRSAGKDRKRVGRGGSRGGTSGRGHKGQKARTSGTVGIGFEGGQMPLYRRIPKRGFSNIEFKNTIYTVNIASIEKNFASEKEITKDMLIKSRLVNIRKSDSKSLIKLLGNASINNKFIIYVDLCSQAAKESIEKVGGEVRFTKES
jgi:large subunit ribosomal protein L15